MILRILILLFCIYPSRGSEDSTKDLSKSDPKVSPSYQYQSLEAYLDYFKIYDRKIDKPSFVIRHDGFAYDKNRYYLYDFHSNRSHIKNYQLISELNEQEQRYIEQTITYFYVTENQIDRNAFKVIIVGFLAEDKDKFYVSVRGKPALVLDKAPVTIINREVFKYNNQLYYSISADKIAIDPASVMAINKNIVKDKHGVYFLEGMISGYSAKPYIVPFKNSDGETFVVLNEHYYKDKNSGYYLSGYNIEVIDGIDFPSFKALKYGDYALDNNNVYWHGYRLEGADPASFTIIDSSYGKDKTNVYYDGTRLMNGVDAASFTGLNKYSYAKDKNFVYKEGAKLKNADTHSFKPLDGYYDKDKNYVYFMGMRLQNLDPTSFKTLKGGYTKDKNGIYWHRAKINDADPSSFVALDQDYGKDNNYIYIKEKIIKQADPETFELLFIDRNDCWADCPLPTLDIYARDNKQVFYQLGKEKEAKIIVKADPKTFVVINKKFTKDKNFVYDNGIASKQYNAQSFVALNYVDDKHKKSSVVGFYKDKEDVYWDGIKISEADNATFEWLKPTLPEKHKMLYYSRQQEEGFAKDKFSVFYKHNRISEVDRETFVLLPYDYAKDKNNIYYIDYAGISIIKGADIETFEVERARGRDKNYCYHGQSIIECPK